VISLLSEIYTKFLTLSESEADTKAQEIFTKIGENKLGVDEVFKKVDDLLTEAGITASG
jgi:hypothetical protein